VQPDLLHQLRSVQRAGLWRRRVLLEPSLPAALEPPYRDGSQKKQGRRPAPFLKPPPIATRLFFGFISKETGMAASPFQNAVAVVTGGASGLGRDGAGVPAAAGEG
jgi:hypothetical protein